ncbi:MAG: hypothetical protein ABL958_07450 [Bdellovibrionia bacterium]
MKILMLVLSLAAPALAQDYQAASETAVIAEAKPEAAPVDEAKAPISQAELPVEPQLPTVELVVETPATEEVAPTAKVETAPAAQTELPPAVKAEPAPAPKKVETAPAAKQDNLEVSTKSASQSEIEQLEYLSGAIQEDLKTMTTSAKEVVETTTVIGRMMMKMRQIDARAQQKPITDMNLAAATDGSSLEKLRSKFEDFKDEHWSRFAIPNFEYRFFKRDRDLVTVQNPVTLRKILEGITAARSKFMPAGCFDAQNKSFRTAPICQRRLAICGQSGFESQEKQLVAHQVGQDFKLEARALYSPDDAEEVLGNRYDTTSDRATLLSDETFYFCKIAARFGATFKAQPLLYPAEVASK